MSTTSKTPQTWLIVGASRGIGHEYVRQLLALDYHVLATVRDLSSSNALQDLASPNLTVLECDISSEAAIFALRNAISALKLGRIDVCVLNAGILLYPARISEISFADLTAHLQTNAVGPLICASALLSLDAVESSSRTSISTIVFTSSDSGSTGKFNAFEDGFGGYAASKVALNQGLRHLAAELGRKYAAQNRAVETPVILAIHPGEVTTDMQTSFIHLLPWEVQGILSKEESISKMLGVIERKGKGGAEEEKDRSVATFWDWEGRGFPW